MKRLEVKEYHTIEELRREIRKTKVGLSCSLVKLIMKNKIITLAILKEARIDENRTPFSTAQISNLLNKYSNLKILVQPSEKRCFKDGYRLSCRT